MLFIVLIIVSILLVLQLAHMKKVNYDSEKYEKWMNKTNTFFDRINDVIK